MADATAKTVTADFQENPVMHGLRDGGQAAMDELGAGDPALGAVLTQLVSVTVLFVAAATSGPVTKMLRWAAWDRSAWR